MSSRAIFAIFAAALCLATAAAAQEQAVFELEDFFDPRLLGTEFGDQGVEVGSKFFSARLLYGAIWDYQLRNSPTEEDPAFVRLAMNYYRGRSQWTVNVTGLDVERNAEFRAPLPGVDGRPQALSDLRVQLKYGRYSLDELDPAGGQGEPDQFVSRSSLSWTVEEQADGGLSHELTYATDVGDLKTAVDFAGSDELGTFFVTYRYVEAAQDEWRLSYLRRSRLWRGRGGKRLDLRLGIGGERTFGHWRWGSARAELGLLVPIRAGKFDSRTNLYLTVAPARRFESRGIDGEFNVEAAVFLSTSVFRRIF